MPDPTPERGLTRDEAGMVQSGRVGGVPVGVVAAVERIIAAREAPLRDALAAAEAALAEMAARRQRAIDQCRHLHQDGKTREQWHLDNCGAMRALAAQTAAVKAVIERADARKDASTRLVTTAALRAALTSGGTDALDRVRAQAWDEGEAAGRENADDGYPDPLVENPYRADRIDGGQE